MLNGAYIAKFGLPFILCIKRHSRASLLRQFETRLSSDAAGERQMVEAEGHHHAPLVASPCSYQTYR